MENHFYQLPFHLVPPLETCNTVLNCNSHAPILAPSGEHWWNPRYPFGHNLCCTDV